MLQTLHIALPFAVTLCMCRRNFRDNREKNTFRISASYTEDSDIKNRNVQLSVTRDSPARIFFRMQIHGWKRWEGNEDGELHCCCCFHTFSIHLSMCTSRVVVEPGGNETRREGESEKKHKQEREAIEAVVQFSSLRLDSRVIFHYQNK